MPHPGARPSDERLLAAREYLRADDLVVEPRKLWPAGVSRKSRIHGTAEGRALAFADDPAWADELVALKRTAYGTVPPELLDGAVEVLRRWSRTWERPVAVVPAPAFSVEASANLALAEHLARVGKLPLVELFAWDGGEAPSDTASTPVVQHLEQAVRVLDPSPLAHGAIPSGPVLLCCTTMRTGWTIAVCSALLAETTGRTAMPLVLHRLP